MSVRKYLDLVQGDAADGAGWISRARVALSALSPDDRPAGWLAYAVRSGRKPSDLSVISASWFDAEGTRSKFAEVVGELLGRATTIRVEERVVIGPGHVAAVRSSDEPVLLLFALLQRIPAQTRAGFARYWWDNHRVLAARDLPPEYPMLGYLHNYVVADDPCEWDGIAEIYEPSMDVARERTKWIATQAGAALLDDEDRFLRKDTRTVYVTDQHVLIPPPKES